MKSIKELQELDAKRTQGVWVASKSARNPRKDIYTEHPRVDTEFQDGTSKDIYQSTFTGEDDTCNADFIAAAPDMMEHINRLVAENEENKACAVFWQDNHYKEVQAKQAKTDKLVEALELIMRDKLAASPLEIAQQALRGEE